MIEFTNCNIDRLSIHFIGNKVNGEDLILSENPISPIDEGIKEMIFHYVTNTFKIEEFFSFTFSTGEMSLNPLYNFSKRIFNDSSTFHQNSEHIAVHLFNQILHPNIKAGEFFIVHFNGIQVNDIRTNGIGLFKFDSKQTFIKVTSRSKDFDIDLQEGINWNKIEKACLVLNTNETQGYQLLIADKTSKGGDARFWKEGFLNVIPATDNFHATKIVMDIAKKYVFGPLEKQHEVSKAEQIDLLNRSVNYFRTTEEYDKENFEMKVLQDQSLISTYRQFEQEYRQERGFGEIDHFDISGVAVKQQARQFKSVIKLDKNFHIYIHGDRNLIEQGVDHQKGKRYYKIYFEEEH